MGKRKQFFHLRYPKPLDRPVYFDELGVQAKMAGVVYSGMGLYALVWLPGQKPNTRLPQDLAAFTEMDSAEGAVEDWAAILQATDNPEIFELDEGGVVKAIHRKSMRAIGGALQWKIWRRDGFRCMYCGVEGNGKYPLTVDHFMPIELGGNDEANNLISCCRACNKRKGSFPPETFCELEGKDYIGLNAYLDGKASSLFISHLNS